MFNFVNEARQRKKYNWLTNIWTCKKGSEKWNGEIGRSWNQFGTCLNLFKLNDRSRLSGILGWQFISSKWQHIRLFLRTWLIMAVIDTTCEIKTWKRKFRLGRNDLCDTGAVFYQLSYLTNWELIGMWVHNMPVDDEDFKSSATIV